MDEWTKVIRLGEMEFQVKMNSRRLAGMLDKVWQSIPVSDRNEISNRLTVVSDDSILRFILADGSYGIDGRDLYGCAVPHTDNNHFVFLNASALRHKSAGFCRYIIAHELAHVWRNHRGGENPQHEAEADETAVRWGYTNPDPLKIETVEEMPA